MSQIVLSRPASQASKVGVLPRIEHPLSRLENPGKMSVRGMSRASVRSGGGPQIQAQKTSRSITMSPQRKDLNPKMPMESIPEGVQVIQSADPNKTTLPIFGEFSVIVSLNLSNKNKLKLYCITLLRHTGGKEKSGSGYGKSLLTLIRPLLTML